MIINVMDDECVIVQTPQGSLHVKIDKRWQTTEIYWNDHAKITLQGSHKKNPTLTVDTEEYPTHLQVKMSEGKWASMEIKSE